MRKMILLAAMTAIAALMLAATPALAQQGPPDKVTICHTPPPNDFTLEVPPQAVPGHLGHGDYLGECEDDGNGEGRDNDRDFRDFCRIFDCRDNRDNDVVPAFEITQDFDQEAESGDIDQSFDVSQTGDNSNQTVGIQGVANTGNAQNQIGVIDAGNFGDFNNDNNDVVFVDDFCDFGDFNGDGICEDFNNRDDFCEDSNGNSFCEDLEDFCEDSNRDNICDFFFDDFDRFNDNDLFFFDDDDNRFFANGDNDGDIEFEDVGSTITVSPTNTTSSDQQVNQAATAFGK